MATIPAIAAAGDHGDGGGHGSNGGHGSHAGNGGKFFVDLFRHFEDTHLLDTASST